MLDGEQSGGLENLKRKLYAPRGEMVAIPRSRLAPLGDDGQTTWAVSETARQPTRKRKFSPWWPIFLSALVFFLLALGTTFFVFTGGGNLVSPTNVELLVDGPQLVKAGEALNFQVLVTNKNTAALQSVDLIAEYPAATRSALDLSKPLNRERWSLGTINPGASTRQTVRVIIFGEKDEAQEIKMKIEYRLADSNAIFDKLVAYSYLISDSPLSLTADWPAEVNAGQLLTLKLAVVSRAASPIQNLVLKAEYPTGFIYQSASPPPASDNSFWRLGDLAPGGRQEIILAGLLEGQNEDAKAFRFSTGVAAAPTATEVELVYDELFKLTTIKHPDVAMSFALNGQTTGGEHLISSAELLRADVIWNNNLPTEILDSQIEIAVEGKMIDQRSVSTAGGFYQSADNLIVWNKGTKSSLARIAPGESGQVSFTFSTLSPLVAEAAAVENPEINLRLRFSGRRMIAGSPDEMVKSELNQRLKINTILQLASVANYHGGPFVNSGPLPPRIGVDTTYTIAWSVINSSNPVDGAVVKATLPTYVRWLNVTSPADERLTFDESTGEVIWNLGLIEAGRGLTSAAREAAFQVALKPSASQIEQAPVLVTAPVLSGTDTFTGQVITYTRRALDTRLLNDSQFRPGDERVTP